MLKSRFSIPWLPKHSQIRSQIWFIIIFNSVFLGWLVLKPVPHAVHVAVDDVLASVGTLLMPVWSIWLLLQRRKRLGERGSSKRFLSSLFLSVGSFLYGLGMATWTYLELIRHQAVLFPSLADACYLLDYPFVCFGVLLIPLRPVPAALRGRVLLDSLMIMTAIMTFSWYFLLGPTLLAGGDTLLAKILSPAYPVADLVLFFCTLLLSAHTSDQKMRPVIRVLSLGLGAIVVGDTVFGYQSLQSGYVTGGIVDVLWPIGYMLVVLAGSMVGRLFERTPSGQEEKSPQDVGADIRVRANPVLWRSLLPYALVPFVGGLLWYTVHRHGDEKLEVGVYAGSVVLVGLILLRQVFAIMENNHLNTFLREAYLELERKSALLEELAVTDGLTGLKNHRAFQQQLKQECDWATRYGTPLSLLMLDVDRFKQYNDAFGHPAGDAVLKKVAETLLINIRDNDFVARYGGEEFVIILPQTDAEGASMIADRFRRVLAGASWEKRPVTASIGVTTLSPALFTPSDLLQSADKALYASKAVGRNQVTHHRDVGSLMLARSEEVPSGGGY